MYTMDRRWSPCCNNVDCTGEIYLLVQQSLVLGAAKSAEYDHHICGVLRGIVLRVQEFVVGSVTLADTSAVYVTTKVYWDPET